MQKQMPIFPEKTKLINSNVGVYQKDGFVYYLHNGSPVHYHASDDLNSHRYILASLVNNELCKTSELSKALGIHIKNVQLYAKALRDKGTEWFFNRDEQRGQCYKFTSEKQEQAQDLLNQGYSAYRVAKETGLSESAIRYHLRSGVLKKKVVNLPQTTTPKERNITDYLASELIGMRATRVETCLDAAFGEQVRDIVRFELCQSVPYGGVLFLLPFLLANGLLSYSLYYSQRERSYYNFDIIVLALAFMYLCRIKNIEQLKHYSPGELGKLLGLDRIPEARCFRLVFKELSQEEQASRWGAYLSQEWIDKDEVEIYYVDGHVQVYHGYLANLGKKHISRQKLCLPGTVEFWVNNAEGMPYFYITGQVNEKLKQALEEEIIPRLNSLQQSKEMPANNGEEDALSPFYTLVFDREAYSPQFFEKIWHQYHVAVITYRKNVKDRWNEKAFETYRSEFVSAAKEADLNSFSDLVHKNTTSIHYIQANQLANKIEDYREALKNPATQREELENLKVSILEEFDKIITGLRSKTENR